MDNKERKSSLELVRDPVVVVDEECNVVYLNEKAKELFGPLKEGQKCYSYIFDFQKPCWNYSGYLCPVKEFKEKDTEAETYVNFVKVKNRLEKFLIRVYNDKKLFAELFLPYQEVREAITAEKGKYPKGVYDEIYLSKEEFEKLLESLLHQKRKFYIVFINIKKLKSINEVYGINAGDLVIKATEQVLGHLSAKFKFKFSQIVGGIFAVLPEEEPKTLEKFEEELLKLLRQVEIEYLNTKIKPRYSITTVEVNPAVIKNLPDLYRLLFYAEKQANGKGISHFFEDKQGAFIEFLHRKEEVSRKIEQFLSQKRVTFHLQPIVDLSTGEISHFELLMRFLENGKVVSAGVYIDFIYEFGLIVDFDLLLLEVLDKNREKLTRLGRPIFLNVSDEDLRVLSYRNRLRELIDNFTRNGIEINLELTEQVMFKNWDFIEVLADNYNLKFAVDDFGTGYSSLKMVADVVKKGLGRYLKLDCSLTKDFDKNEYIQALVESVVTFARKTELKLVAECVETEKEYNLLKELGINYGQGWYFYKPMPLEEALKLVGG